MPLTPAELRTQLLDLIRRDLLGPAAGEDEIVDEPSVRDRYVLGVLAPAGMATSDDEPADGPLADPTDLDATIDASDEDGPADPAPTKTQGMAATSIGLTFTVDGQATALLVTAAWGRYVRCDHPNPEQLTSKGQRRRVWQRTQVRGVSPPIPLAVGMIPPWSPAPDWPEVVVRGLVRRRDDEWSVTLYLTNGQHKPKGPTAVGVDAYWLFQPELAVAAPDSAPIFCRHLRLRDTVHRDPEDLAMQMAYRHQVEFGVGHGVAVAVELAPGAEDRAVRLATAVMPTLEVGRTTPPTPADLPLLGEVVLDMQTLAELPDTAFAAALSPLAAAYAAWIDEQAARAAAPELGAYGAAPQDVIAAMRANLTRIRAGIALLGEEPQAAAAFRFANRAMALQRSHTLYAQHRRQGGAATLAEFDLPANRRWYPFQLAFILLNLPALTQIDHPERSDPTAAVADLLWFPTGGGKTEAYLGLTAYTLAIRRLQGVVAGHSGLAGRGGAHALYLAPAHAPAVSARGRARSARVRSSARKPWPRATRAGAANLSASGCGSAAAARPTPPTPAPKRSSARAKAGARPTRSPPVPGAAAPSARIATCASRCMHAAGAAPSPGAATRWGNVPSASAARPTKGCRWSWWTRRSIACCPAC